MVSKWVMQSSWARRRGEMALYFGDVVVCGGGVCVRGVILRVVW